MEDILEKFVYTGFDYEIADLDEGSDLEIAEKSFNSYNKYNIADAEVMKSFGNYFGILKIKTNMPLLKNSTLAREHIVKCFDFPLSVGLRKNIFIPRKKRDYFRKKWDSFQYFEKNHHRCERFDFVAIDISHKDCNQDRLQIIEDIHLQLLDPNISYRFESCRYEQY